MYYWLDRWRKFPHSKNTTTCSFYLNSVWISAVVRKPLPLRSRHLNKYVKPSGASLFSRASTKSRKLSKSISRALPPPIFPRRTCSSKTSNYTNQKKFTINTNSILGLYKSYRRFKNKSTQMTSDCKNGKCTLVWDKTLWDNKRV